MSTIEDGGPAFPLAEPGNCVSASEGMTLRDYFAAKAMQGFCAREVSIECSADDIADDAYAMADAMLAARKPNPNQ